MHAELWTARAAVASTVLLWACSAPNTTPDGERNVCGGTVVLSTGGPCEAVGRCRAGVVECAGPNATRCSTRAGGSEDTSADELCDGVDNDCDGDTDEGFDLATACDGVGACGAGLTECAGDRNTRCSTDPGGSMDQSAAADASCDDVDDDCDGQTDEDYAGLPTTCGVGACEASGAMTCVGGAVQDSCAPGTAAADDATCDGVDDNCDGMDDEGYVSVVTTCGTGACARTGSTACIAGAPVDSCSPGTAAATDVTCDGVDDNCDGMDDEGYVATSTTCGVGACGATGQTSCALGVELSTCTPGTPAAADATCDGVDDNCNGIDDEGYVATSTTCGVGACTRTATTSCVAGQIASNCVAGTAALNDATCDGVDDNCDGFDDEGYVATSTTCGVGACARTGTTSCGSGVEGSNCVAGTPAATDSTCDGIDDNCNGLDDEGAAICECLTDQDCADAAFCNGSESCDGGACLARAPPVCVDTDPCTIDTCSELAGMCSNANDPTCVPSCSSDYLENNDIMADAVALPSGFYPGLTSCNGDEDWYSVTVGNNELIEVLLSFQDAIGDVNMRLFDAGGQSLDVSFSGTDDERIAYSTPGPGTYFLLVSFNESGGDDDDVDGNTYDMNIAIGAPCTDRFEDNDDLAAAALLPGGVETGLRACPSDDDWYEVQLTDNQLLIVDATFEDARGNIDLRLYDEMARQVAVALSGDDNERLVYTAQYTGSYFLRVQLGGIGADDIVPGNDYELDIDVNSTCTDAFESNDDRATAAPLSAGTASALTACPSDEDWYSFTAGNNELIAVDVRFIDAFGNLDLRLYDGDGTQIAVSLSGTDDESILITAPADGTYFARVVLAGPDDLIPGNDYSLELGLGTPCTDLFEDDDELIAAAPLGSGTFTGLQACPGDDDYFALDLAAPTTITIDVTFTDAAGDINARLYDGSGTQVAVGLSGTDNEQIVFGAPAAGLYVLRTRLISDDATPGNGYGLSIAGPVPCPRTSCVDQSAECGPLHDGCGTVLDCGTCAGMELCSDNNRCGCVPATCASLGANCGQVSDGCGTILDCGVCTTPEICGGSRVDNVCAAPACLPDGFEDNDDFTGASLLAAGVYPDLTLCPPDLDYYRFDTVDNELLVLTADFIDAEGDVNLRLYDAAFRQVDASLSGTNRERIVFTAAGGAYYLRADMRTSGGDDVIPGAEYDLTAATGTLCTDALEDNDSQATARAITSGDHTALFACPDDEDWYRITAGDNQLIDATLRFLDATGNIDMRLYDAAGAQVAVSLTGTDDERISYSTPAAGDYFLRVSLLEAGDDQVPGNGYSLELSAGDPCTDVFENNDSLAAAAPMISGLQAGLTSCPFDEDWYRVLVADNQLIDVTVAFTDAEGNIDLRLYDGRGAQVAVSLSGTDDERIAYTSLSAGTYYVRVVLAGGDEDPPGASYDLSLDVGTPCTDPYENNDLFESPYVLGAGTFAWATSCPYDEDWYQLEATAGSTLTVDLTFLDAAGNIDLRVYDPGGGQVAAALSGTDDEQVQYVPAVSGAHSVRVVLASDDLVPGNSYSMAIAGAAACVPTTTCVTAGAQCGPVHDGCGVMLDCGACPGGGPCSANNICGCVAETCGSLTAGCGAPEDGCGASLFCGFCTAPLVCGGAYVDFSCDLPDCIADALEDNDTRQTAPEMSSGTYADLTACPGDEDWYELDVGNNTVIDINVRFDAARGNIDARLLNASGTQLDASLSGTDNERIVYTTPANGTYFLRTVFVTSGGDDAVPGNRYVMELDTTGVCTDAFEDNDRDVDATPLGSGNYLALTACPNDEDWYVFTMGNNELIEVDLEFTDAFGNIDARLYNASGTQIAAALSGTNDERIVYTTSETGAYRLRVVHVEAGDDAVPGNTYRMPLSVGTACTDALEDNDTLAGAAPIMPGALTGLTACPSDEDWYRVEVAAGRTLTVGATFLHGSGNIDLRLYDPSGGQVAASLSGTDDEQIVYQTPDAGPYYARVVLAGDDALPGNDYALQVTDAP